MLDFAADRNGFGLVDLFTRVIAIKFYLLRVEIVQLIDQHDIAFTLAVLEIRRSVAADVDHASLHLVIEALLDFLLRERLPTAFDGGVVIDDATLRGRLFWFVVSDGECDNHGNDHQNGKRNEADVDGAELCFPFVHG